MARRRNSAPSYVLHKQSGRGRLAWTDSVGIRHQKLLPGQFGSVESLTAKARLELGLATSPPGTPADPESITVAEVMIAYLDFAEQHHRDQEGNPTDEVRHLKAAIRHVRELYGEVPTTEFGPLALKVVRQKFVEQKWCRKTVNARVERIRRIFKWAVAEELVPLSVHHGMDSRVKPCRASQRSWGGVSIPRGKTTFQAVNIQRGVHQCGWSRVILIASAEQRNVSSSPAARASFVPAASR